MKQTFNILFVLLLCLPTLMFAQNNGNQKEVCGTDFTPEMESRLLRNIAAAKQLGLPAESRVITYVGINFHLVGNNDGSSRASVDGVLEALCVLNQRYADQEIQFFIKNLLEMNSTVVNSHSNTQTSQFQMSLRKNANNNGVNIFVCNSVNTSSVTSGTVLGYYSPSYDLIAIRANQMNTTSTTLTHEMGHFLSLPHPFNGWEGVEYHTTDNPSGAPYTSSNLPPASLNGNLVELANGNNCSNAGDYFCDTEPDYNLGFLGGNNCNYSQGAVDPSGAAINPDESLYMSYFNDNCQNKFSDEQKAAIAADLADFSRNYIKSTPANTADVTTPVALVSPANNGTTFNFDEVYLDWDDVPGANTYFVQIARNQSFSLLVEETVVTNSLYTTGSLSANTNYYWRVKAYNEVSVCNPFSATRKFTTSSFPVSTDKQFDVTTIKLQPNLANEGQVVNLNITTERKIDATIRIINVNGQVMKNVANINFQAGTHVHQIETAGLAPGVYIVNLRTDLGQVNERLVITK